MNFRTELIISPSDFKLSHYDKILTIGSCFTENIGLKLEKSGFQTDINPFGILYNPLSVASAIETLISRKLFSQDDIFEYQGKYHSFSHHSKFSASTPDECLKNINEKITFSSGYLHKTSLLIVTFGTSYIYKLKETDQLVSNCHKLPANHFLYQRLDINEIVSAWDQLLYSLSEINPEIKILMTVSPIRHWKDGAHENQISKSILLLAIEELSQKYPFIRYFPAYEIVLDDLRDYRFYAEDMLHPSSSAVDYIWEKFGQTYFSAETIKEVKKYQEIRQALDHKPFNPDSEEYKSFLSQKTLQLNDFVKKYREDYL